MGLAWHSLRFLCETRNSGVVFGRTVTIARQHCDVSVPRVLRILADYGVEVPSALVERIRNAGYVEPVFNCLGATQVDSIDNSTYESATEVWDMNQPIPAGWREKYDLVYDGGSLEHIFNVPQALANYMNLARVGGHVVVHTMANNWFGHGFYQLSPELFYRVFSPENGFVVERMVVFEDYEHAPMYEVPDPAAIGSRIELSNSWVGVDLIVLARRDAPTTPFGRWPQQSDYARRWANSATAPTQPVPPTPSTKRRLIEGMKRTLPGLVELKHKLLYRVPALSRHWRRYRSAAYHRGRSFEAQPDRFRHPSRPSRAR